MKMMKYKYDGALALAYFLNAKKLAPQGNPHRIINVRKTDLLVTEKKRIDHGEGYKFTAPQYVLPRGIQT